MLEKNEDTTFYSFLQKSKNICEIWEIIICHMSGTDVARCLKVGKLLRFVIGQCLNRNSRLRSKVDVAASASAICRSFIIHSTPEDKIKQVKRLDNYLDDVFDEIDKNYVLDDTWYYRWRGNSWISIHRPCHDTGQVVESLHKPAHDTDPIETLVKFRKLSLFSVQPTANPDKIIIEPAGPRGGELFNLADGSCVYEAPDPCKYPTTFEELRSLGFAPLCGYWIHKRCIESEEKYQIAMLFTNPNGEIRDSVILYEGFKRRGDFGPPMRKLEGKKQLLILLKGTLALHDAKTGDVFWKTPCIGGGYFIRLFMTDSVVGYLLERHVEESPKDTFEVHVFDAANGEFVGCHLTLGLDENSEITTRGPYICIPEADGQSLTIIKIVNKTMKKYALFFPMYEFGDDCNWQLDLIGVVGKTSVLIGQFRNFRLGRLLLFSLDLDTISMDVDEQHTKFAFSLPVDSENVQTSGRKLPNDYQPVHRTDRSTGEKELIGVIRTTAATEDDNLTVQTYMFVDKMEFLTDEDLSIIGEDEENPQNKRASRDLAYQGEICVVLDRTKSV